jgi:hypothetical protein
MITQRKGWVPRIPELSVILTSYSNQRERIGVRTSVYEERGERERDTKINMCDK